jgi:hypothetical protein
LEIDSGFCAVAFWPGRPWWLAARKSTGRYVRAAKATACYRPKIRFCQKSILPKIQKSVLPKIDLAQNPKIDLAKNPNR